MFAVHTSSRLLRRNFECIYSVVEHDHEIEFLLKKDPGMEMAFTKVDLRLGQGHLAQLYYRSFYTYLLMEDKAFSRVYTGGTQSRSKVNFGSDREEAVVLTKNGNMIVCWHPEFHCPYEHTKPLPESPKVDSVLKVQYNEDVKNVFKSKHPFFINQKLRELTFTNKHQWFHRPGRKFAKPNPPRDRKYM